MPIINVRLLVKILVQNESGEILLMQRSATDNVRPLGWDVPGGNVEYGEDPNAAMLRELKEEAGLEVKDSQIFYVTSETESHYIVILFYRATTNSTDVQLSHEHEQYKWIPPAEMATFDIPQKYKTAAALLSEQT